MTFGGPRLSRSAHRDACPQWHRRCRLPAHEHRTAARSSGASNQVRVKGPVILLAAKRDEEDDRALAPRTRFRPPPGVMLEPIHRQRVGRRRVRASQDFRKMGGRPLSLRSARLGAVGEGRAHVGDPASDRLADHLEPFGHCDAEPVDSSAHALLQRRKPGRRRRGRGPTPASPRAPTAGRGARGRRGTSSRRGGCG